MLKHILIIHWTFNGQFVNASLRLKAGQNSKLPSERYTSLPLNETTWGTIWDWEKTMESKVMPCPGTRPWRRQAPERGPYLSAGSCAPAASAWWWEPCCTPCKCTAARPCASGCGPAGSASGRSLFRTHYIWKVAPLEEEPQKHGVGKNLHIFLFPPKGKSQWAGETTSAITFCEWEQISVMPGVRSTDTQPNWRQGLHEVRHWEHLLALKMGVRKK